MSDLDATERWMRDAIADPGGAGGRAAADVVRGSARLGAAERLALYGRTYRRRLLDCLREGYPGLRNALGDELFDDFADDYLRAQPPRSYTLASLGAGWPAHLEATRPLRERWPAFLVDLARLERAFFEVYDGPGAEGERLAAAADLPADADPGSVWGTATVTTVVCLRILRARFPVGGYLVAVRRGESPPLPAPARCWIAVSRRDYVVTLAELDAGESALLLALSAAATAAVAAEAAGLAWTDAWRLLRGFADRGLIAAVRSGRPVANPTTGVIRC